MYSFLVVSLSAFLPPLICFSYCSQRSMYTMEILTLPTRILFQNFNSFHWCGIKTAILTWIRRIYMIWPLLILFFTESPTQLLFHPIFFVAYFTVPQMIHSPFYLKTFCHDFSSSQNEFFPLSHLPYCHKSSKFNSFMISLRKLYSNL